MNKSKKKNSSLKKNSESVKFQILNEMVILLADWLVSLQTGKANCLYTFQGGVISQPVNGKEPKV